MKNGEEKDRMTPREIQELMDLKGWSRTQLAAALEMCETSIYRWMKRLQQPTGPASILMRQWLQEARDENAAGSRK